MEGSFPINETAHKLFYSLLERAAAGKFDESFLLELVRYHQAFPESERYEALYACYALAQDAPLVALEYGEKAYRKRLFSPAIWRLMADIYRALERTAEEARFRGWLARWETKAEVEKLRTKTCEFYWETVALIAFDGRVDRSRFTYRLYTREDVPREVRDAGAEHRFLGIAERHTRAVAENGEIWPDEMETRG